ncbi:MAG: ATP synthase F1 subunit epsilon [Planctomycetota bacterium]
MAQSSSTGGLRCVVVTPEQTVIDTTASYVVTPLYDGEIGIAAGHSPMIGRLGFGELRITTAEGKVEPMYVDGGFVQVADDTISVMTGRAKKLEELDVAESEKRLEAALDAPAASGEGLVLRQRAIDQARGMLRVARRTKAGQNGKA